MNLKESFRYQNFLNEKMSKVATYLSYTPNVTLTKQEHCRKKANPDAFDEIIEDTKDRELKVPVNDLMDFIVHIIAEKQKLSDAISDAKNSCDIDIDSAIAMNKDKQAMAMVFSHMGSIQSSERTVTGRDFKFNNDGEQKSYIYDIKEVTTIDFDRKKAKGISKKFVSESDDVSNKLDRIMIDTEVYYVPIYDVNDSLEDVLEQYISDK